MSKAVKGVFLASILVNVLLLGVLLGELPHRGERCEDRQDRKEKVLAQLPEPARTRVREAMERLQKDNEPVRERIREAREAAIRILTTEPFDSAAYDRQVSQISELRGQMAKHMAEVIKEIAKDLPPEHRGVLAGMLRRVPHPSAK
jgi:uncharacterized membrane protein